MTLERLYLLPGEIPNREAALKLEASACRNFAYKIRIEALVEFDDWQSPLGSVREIYSTNILAEPKAFAFVGMEEFYKMSQKDDIHAPALALYKKGTLELLEYPFGRDIASRLRRNLIGHSMDEFSFRAIRNSAIGRNLLLFLDTWGAGPNTFNGLLFIDRSGATNLEEFKVTSHSF